MLSEVTDLLEVMYVLQHLHADSICSNQCLSWGLCNSWILHSIMY